MLYFPVMWKNYFVTAVRNFNRSKLFSFINILGLAVGMAACLLILRYVRFENSYDKFHPDSERIYRLRYERASEEGKTVRFASCCPPAADVIRGAYPEVEVIARIFRYRAVVTAPEREVKFTEDRMYFAEPDFFRILKFEQIKGDAAGDSASPGRAFVSRSTALKYFGPQDPMGKVLTVDGRTDYEITGIFEDVKQNSHLKFDILLSYKNLESIYGPDVLQSWGHTGFFTYLKLKPGASPEEFENKMTSLVDSQCGEMMRAYKVLIELKMQPLEDIHLSSHFLQEFEINGSRSSVSFMFLVAVFVVIMAWINYINLTTARALVRAKEMGLRKIVGALRRHLFTQLFFETLLTNGLALILAITLVQILLPPFNKISGTPPGNEIWTAPWFWAAAGIMLLAGVFLSGVYPAAAVSAFQPEKVLKGKMGNSPKGINLRKILVIFQFGVALILITGAMTVYRQVYYMKSQDLGFNLEQVLVMNAPRVRGENFVTEFDAFREELLKHPDISKFCVVTEVPGRQLYWDAGAIRRAGEDPGKGKNYMIVGIDYNFLDVFDLRLAEGRNFSKEFSSDDQALILNQTAVKWMGFQSDEEAVGKKVDYWGQIFTIVGVLRDYHQQSLKSAFEPQIFRLLLHGRGERGRFALKVSPNDIQKTIEFAKIQYQSFFPDNPFEHFFLDDYYDQQYASEELLGGVVGIFAILSVLVTGLGIFGMSAFAACRRTREIGIRKVLGAGSGDIIRLLSKDFLLLLGLSVVIAWPVVFYGINAWLNGFARRMTIGIPVFLIPLGFIAIVAALAVGSNVFRAARLDPVESLKYE